MITPPRQRNVRLALGAGLLVLVGAVLAGCGGGSSAGVSAPTVGAARIFRLTDFRPASPVLAGRPTTLSFTITQPSGQPLAAYKRCCEPHAGVDLIIVRSDDSHVLYEESDIAAGGRITQPVVFPAPGRYRIVVDAYPVQTGPQAPFNFQLFASVNVRGAYHPTAVPRFSATQIVDGFKFRVQGTPHLKAIQASFLSVDVRDPRGRKVVFTSWRGALAHAIFFRQGSLDYFHTHVCAPSATFCTSVLGGAKVTGTSSTAGKLKVGILVPVPGIWRMFLLTYMHGHVLTAPFTLEVTGG